jgi:hypothetical protein
MNKENAPLLTCLQNTGGSFEMLGIMYVCVFGGGVCVRAIVCMYATQLYKFSNASLSILSGLKRHLEYIFFNSFIKLNE